MEKTMFNRVDRGYTIVILWISALMVSTTSVLTSVVCDTVTPLYVLHKITRTWVQTEDLIPSLSVLL